MKIKIFIFYLLLCTTLLSCNNYNNIIKTADYTYKYEMAKQYYLQGYYTRASYLLNDVIKPLKGTDRGEESLFLLGLSEYQSRNLQTASDVFQKYVASYPRGIYTEEAQYYSGIALLNSTPETRLDQTETYEAIRELQKFLELFPASKYTVAVHEHIFTLQDKLVEKEYLVAKQYYDMGTYFGNGGNGNYKACIVTAENAIKDYPYNKRREDFSFLILKAKIDFAKISITSKQEERYNDAIEEYYAFYNEFPESKYLSKANSLYKSIPNAFKPKESLNQ